MESRCSIASAKELIVMDNLMGKFLTVLKIFSLLYDARSINAWRSPCHLMSLLEGALGDLT